MHLHAQNCAPVSWGVLFAFVPYSSTWFVKLKLAFQSCDRYVMMFSSALFETDFNFCLFKEVCFREKYIAQTHCFYFFLSFPFSLFQTRMREQQSSAGSRTRRPFAARRRLSAISESSSSPSTPLRPGRSTSSPAKSLTPTLLPSLWMPDKRMGLNTNQTVWPTTSVVWSGISKSTGMDTVLRGIRSSRGPRKL